MKKFSAIKAIIVSILVMTIFCVPGEDASITAYLLWAGWSTAVLYLFYRVAKDEHSAQ